MGNDLGISVQEMIDNQLLDGAKLIAGQKGLNRKIRQLNVMEVPDILNWVSEGEFLLTTLYSIKDDEEAKRKLLPDLYHKGISAIGIKPGRYIDQIPDVMVKFSNEVGLPLFTIAENTSFAKIINNVNSYVFNKYLSFLKHSENVHRQLMDVVLNDGGIKALVHVLARIIGNPVLIADFGLEQSEADSLDDNLTVQTLEETVKKKKYSESPSQGYEQFQDCLNGKNVQSFIFPIKAGNRILGNIFIWEWAKPLQRNDFRSIENCTAFAALEMLKLRAVLDVQSKYQQEFIEDLLSPESQLRVAALDKAKYFGFNTSIPHAVCFVQEEGVNEGEVSDEEHNLRLRKVIETYFKNHRKDILCAIRKNSFIFLYPFRTTSLSKAKSEIFFECRKFLSYMDSYLKNTKLIIGIGRAYHEPLSLWKSYLEARKGIIAAGLVNTDRVIHFDDLGVYRILSMVAAGEEASLFCRDILAPLIEYDSNNNRDLMETLEVYFKFNGNLKAVSKAMFTHYNTIIYRIQRIEEILQLKLTDPEDRLCIELALKLYKLSNY
ncbi:MAG: PucR family transcriptional regulator [Bacillota bacterium]|jgi:purine catabolism regulator